MVDCEESIKKELKDFDRAAKSEVGRRAGDMRGGREIKRANGS